MAGPTRVEDREMTYRTSAQWSERLELEILDPDGWDRQNFEASWTEEISKAEFWKRAARSTTRDLKALRERR